MHGLRRPLRILVGLPQLAELLHHSPDGLRVALRTSQPYALQIRQARVKIGRRGVFPHCRHCQLSQSSCCLMFARFE